MAYTKTNWQDSPNTTTPLDADNLNNIEQGIYQNSLDITTNSDNIGTLSSLTTSTKTDLVSAINELKSSINNSGTSYIKFDDGTMITYQEETTAISCDTAWGSLYFGSVTTAYNFPQAFISIPTVIYNVISTSASSFINASMSPLNVTTTSVQNFGIVRPTANTSVPVKITILAIGKWK